MIGDIHPPEHRIELLWKHAKEIQGSGMSEERAMELFAEASSEAMVIRNWFLSYEPSADQRSDTKPFRLVLGEILARNNEPDIFDHIMMCSSPMTAFINNNIFISINCTYLLVGAGGVIESLKDVIDEAF
ncbi:hypothetical protein [Pseudomonas asplenii]|uniref:hypothetical protein n=1 Tax=Pseudomonas asplenii TaxID=53407 RepID=UPI0012FAF7ED|nr:hypothetical protein [Pseudomonas fuscovaginae]